MLKKGLKRFKRLRVIINIDIWGESDVMKDSIRVIKYDVLRVAACFSIVLLHVSNSYLTVVDVSGNHFLVLAAYNGLTRFAVPVFFMLSGLFLVSPERNITTKKVFKKITHLLVCFYVWSAFYAFQGVFVNILRGENFEWGG